VPGGAHDVCGQLGLGNGGGGGALYLGNGSALSAVFSNCLFRANLVQNGGSGGSGGGGVLFAEMNASRTGAFVNCSFVANTNANRAATAARSRWSRDARTEELHPVDQPGDRNGATGHDLSRAGGTLDVRYSSVTGRSAPQIAGAVTFTGGREGDPLFASLAICTCRARRALGSGREELCHVGRALQQVHRCG